MRIVCTCSDPLFSTGLILFGIFFHVDFVALCCLRMPTVGDKLLIASTGVD